MRADQLAFVLEFRDLNTVKCNLTKLTTKSEVGAAVIMVSDI